MLPGLVGVEPDGVVEPGGLLGVVPGLLAFPLFPSVALFLSTERMVRCSAQDSAEHLVAYFPAFPASESSAVYP